MNNVRKKSTTRPRPARQIDALRLRLAESEALLRSIRLGHVDAVVVAGKSGPQVFTLQGAEQAYRMLIESMNEGALTLAEDKTILYANQCFARMVGRPLEQVIGGSFRHYISETDRAVLRLRLRDASQTGTKLLLHLKTADGRQLPVQVSIRRLAQNGVDRAPTGLVVTDLTEARRTEDQLRALTHRVVQVQEAERGRVALELHDHITQLLCAVLFRSQALADSLAGGSGYERREAKSLHRIISQAAREVERISRGLRTGVLDQLGLVAVLRDTGREFAKRTGVPVQLTRVHLTERLLPPIELALFRILQEALKNVELHARARHVTLELGLEDDAVLLAIRDDGVGFDAVHSRNGNETHHGLGLQGMRERATQLGGTLTIKSLRRSGTEITARIPLTAPAVESRWGITLPQHKLLRGKPRR